MGGQETVAADSSITIMKHLILSLALSIAVLGSVSANPAAAERGSAQLSGKSPARPKVSRSAHPKFHVTKRPKVPSRTPAKGKRPAKGGKTVPKAGGKPGGVQRTK